ANDRTGVTGSKSQHRRYSRLEPTSEFGRQLTKLARSATVRSLRPDEPGLLRPVGYGLGLIIVTVMANGPGLVFFILAALSAATAMQLRP
ncbi:MAG: hypothetical protein WB774_06970, partial [Xanthobacteraceae bacterium]